MLVNVQSKLQAKHKVTSVCRIEMIVVTIELYILRLIPKHEDLVAFSSE